jgi:MerC mercury resistance protein
MAGRLAHHHHSHSGSVFSALWDKLGIFASALCLIDCIVLPIVSTALLSFQSAFVWAEKLHWLLLPLIGLTAGMAFYHSWKAHRSYLIVASGVTGFLLLMVGEIFEAKLRFFAVNWVSVAGSVFLIGAHVRNLVMHLSHKHSCTVDHAAQGRNHFGRQPVRVIADHAEHVAHMP